MLRGISPITLIINHLSDTALVSAASGAVGYLFARSVKYLVPKYTIDPKASLCCGLIAGGLGGLVWQEGANPQSLFIAFLAIVWLPHQICEKKNLPLSFKASVIVSAVSLLTVMISQFVYQQLFGKKTY